MMIDTQQTYKHKLFIHILGRHQDSHYRSHCKINESLDK